MTETYVPGPWKLAEAVESKRQPSMRRIRSVTEGTEHGAICEVYGINDGTPAAANARLIVAAPKLLEAAYRAIELINKPGNEGVFEARTVLASAINEAEGRRA